MTTIGFQFQDAVYNVSEMMKYLVDRQFYNCGPNEINVTFFYFIDY